MIEAIVVDVGNTRIKWGRCVAGRVADVASLPPADTDAWASQWDAWSLTAATPWTVAGVHPDRRDRLLDWLRQRGASATLLASYHDLPIGVALPNPGGVGIDRLLNAVAVNARRRTAVGAVVVDAGSAVTVDYVDSNGVFRGGVIFPGFGLMAKSLHDYTALLPIVPLAPDASAPGEATIPAIQAGLLAAVVGGTERVLAEYQRRFGVDIDLFLTGGDGAVIAGNLAMPAVHLPELTLEGVRLSGGLR